MEIILSKQCESLTGSLGRGFGYFIVRRNNSFYSVRSKHQVPPDGHWRFIVACAQLTQNKLHITDISVPREELSSALKEAAIGCPVLALSKSELNASDILNLKTTFGL